MTGRILVLLGDALDAPGGIAQYNRDLIAAWSDSDSVSEIVLAPRFGCVTKSALPAKVMQKAPVSGLLAYVLSVISTSLRHRPFDFVFCAHLNFAPLAWFISRLLAIPMWLQLHGIEAWERPSRLLRWAAEHASLVTSVSRHTRRMFLRWADLPPSVVHVLPNTVGEQFVPNGERKSAVENHGLSGNSADCLAPFQAGSLQGS